MVDIKIVVGANYGDEGKGLVTDFICRKAKSYDNNKVVNVLVNGGCQRGHTVVDDEHGTHVFHHFGSGTFAGADNYFCPKFIINPMRFVDEYFTLKNTFNITPTVLLDEKCRLQFPGDIAANWYLEQTRGINKHGSTGCGIWETVKRFKKSYESARLKNLCCGMTLDYFITQLSDDERFNAIKSSGKYWLELTKIENGFSESYSEVEELFLNDGFIKHYIEDCKTMYQLCKIVDEKYICKNYNDIVLEFGQGLLLDKKLKAKHKKIAWYDYDFVYTDNTTPSSTGAYDAAWVVKTCLDENIEIKNIDVFYVTRTYLTRHGAGDFKEDEKLTKLLKNSDTTNVYNKWQDSIKYGVLDINECKNRIKQDFLEFYSNILCIKTIPAHNSLNVKANIVITHAEQFSNTELQNDFLKLFRDRHNLYIVYGPKASDIKICEVHKTS